MIIMISRNSLSYAVPLQRLRSIDWWLSVGVFWMKAHSPPRRALSPLAQKFSSCLLWRSPEPQNLFQVESCFLWTIKFWLPVLVSLCLSRKQSSLATFELTAVLVSKVTKNRTKCRWLTLTLTQLQSYRTKLNQSCNKIELNVGFPHHKSVFFGCPFLKNFPPISLIPSCFWNLFFVGYDGVIPRRDP